MVIGKVVRNGMPLEGAYVRLLGPSGEFVSERRTGVDGAFRFHVPLTGWTLVAFAPGTPRVTREIADEKEIVVDLGGS